MDSCCKRVGCCACREEETRCCGGGDVCSCNDCQGKVCICLEDDCGKEIPVDED